MAPIVTSNGWTLHYTLPGLDKAAPVRLGDEVPDFRGDVCVVRGGRPPHKVNSSGFVSLSGTETTYSNEFYPSVIGARWWHDTSGGVA